MPRKPVTYKDFIGLNMAKDPKLLKPGELSECINAICDRGIIRNMGGPSDVVADMAVKSNGTWSGRNLMAFASDYAKNGDSEQTHYYVIVDTDGDLKWYDIDDHDSTPTLDDIESGAFGGDVAQLNAIEGAIYAGNADLEAGSGQNKIHRYYKRDRFQSGTYNLDGWTLTNQKLPAPVVAGSNPVKDSTTPDNSAGVVNSSNTPSVSVSYQANTSGDVEPEWQKDWRVGVSLVYGKGESLITQIGSMDLTGVDVTGLKLYLGIGVVDDGVLLDPRITAAKVYLREGGSDQWSLHGIWDIAKGGSEPYSGKYVSWTEAAGSGGAGHVYAYAAASADYMDIPLRGVFDYFSQTGHGNDIEYPYIGHAGEGYAAATLIGKIFYRANTAREIGGAIIQEPAKVYPSEPECYEKTLVEKGFDVSDDEGDRVVVMESWSGRLLIWTERKFIIYNVTNPLAPRQELILNNMGVNAPCGVFKSDIGIFWANDFGAYMFNDRGVRNILERDGVQLIPQHAKDTAGVELYGSTRSWSGFTPSPAKTMVGFDPGSKQLIILRGANGYTGDLYLINMLNGAISYGNSKWTTGNKSNFINDYLGRLVCLEADSGTVADVVEWDPEPQASDNVVIGFRDEDFGFPDRDKYVYGATVRSRASATANTPFRYEINGIWHATPSTYDNFDTNASGTPDLPSGTEFTDTWMPIDSKVKCKSFKGVIDIDDSGLYEIAEYSIEHRVLEASRAS